MPIADYFNQLPRPQQAPQPQQTQQMGGQQMGGSQPSLEGFRSFILQKYPKIDKTNLSALNDFVSSQQRSQLVEKGGLPFEDLAADDPGAALGLINKGYKPKSKKSSDPAEMRRQTALTTIQGLKEIKPTTKNSTGTPTADSVAAKLGFPLGIGKKFIGKGTESDLADLESRYFTLVQAALTTIQGSRPSDYDVKSYQQKLGPSIQNTPQVNEDRIANMYRLMGGEEQEEDFGGQRPPLSNFEE